MDVAYEAFKKKKEQHLLFLGDLNSLDTAAYLLVKWLLSSDKITILKGNHENCSLNNEWYFKHSNFTYRQIIKQLKLEESELQIFLQKMDHAFSLLPIAAKIKNRFEQPYYFCVHGGIEDHFSRDFRYIKSLPASQSINSSDENVCDFLWADINISNLDERWNVTEEGKRYKNAHGRKFGIPLLQEFKQQTGFHAIIRGHNHGVKIDQCIRDDISCYTTIASPKEAKGLGNLLFIDPDMKLSYLSISNRKHHGCYSINNQIPLVTK